MIFGRRQFAVTLVASLAAASSAEGFPSPDDEETPGDAAPARSVAQTGTPVEATPSKPTEEFQAQDIQFIGEQDGAPEKVLKDRLVAFFSASADVSRAYLVRVRYAPDSDGSVALALRADSTRAASIVEKVSSIFAGWSSSGNHLDIVFLNDDQESRLLKVCGAFFQRGVKQ
jgi:hypothetical protein